MLLQLPKEEEIGLLNGEYCLHKKDTPGRSAGECSIPAFINLLLALDST